MRNRIFYPEEKKNACWRRVKQNRRWQWMEANTPQNVSIELPYFLVRFILRFDWCVRSDGMLKSVDAWPRARSNCSVSIIFFRHFIAICGRCIYESRQILLFITISSVGDIWENCAKQISMSTRLLVKSLVVVLLPLKLSVTTNILLAVCQRLKLLSMFVGCCVAIWSKKAPNRCLRLRKYTIFIWWYLCACFSCLKHCIYFFSAMESKGRSRNMASTNK